MAKEPESAKPGTCVSGYTGQKRSRPFEKWWEIANDRRQKLIVREHKKGDLTFSQRRELEMLQKICNLVIEYQPFCCVHDKGSRRRVCSCRCHLVGHKHKRDANGRCTVCLEKLEGQREFIRRERRADRLLAMIKKNGGL